MRIKPSGIVKQMVERSDLSSAGWAPRRPRGNWRWPDIRGAGAEYAFLAFRTGGADRLLPDRRRLHLFHRQVGASPSSSRSASAIAAAYLGIKAPEVFLSNTIAKRRQGARASLSEHARPAADLRRIRHVDRTRGPQGQPGNRRREHRHGGGNGALAAEMSYLEERRTAFENLASPDRARVHPFADHCSRRSRSDTARRSVPRCAFSPRKAAINA